MNTNSSLPIHPDKQCIQTSSEISLIEKALEQGAKILANFKGGHDENKLEQWQACYALLFKQLNDAAQEICRLQKASEPVSVSVKDCTKAIECCRLTKCNPSGAIVHFGYDYDLQHIVKTVLDAAQVKYVD